MPSSVTAPRWMTTVLWLAAAYNLAWGLLIVGFPLLPFAWAGMDAPRYPAIVQCLGMVIGVYGIGYAIAARDPVTHWPIVLVGLLGKVFGPIGFIWTAVRGEFPWIAGLTILTNDLIWWLPFFAMLLYAAREHDAERMARTIGTLDDELQQARTDAGPSLWELSQTKPLLVVFIRHAGCTFCREALSDLHRQLPQIRAAGVEPVVVHMSSLVDGRQLLDQYQLTDVAQISDPQRKLYSAFELPLGTLQQLSGPHVIWRAVAEGTLFQHGIGKMVGNGLQLGGAFVVEQGRITRAYRNQTSADRISFADLACSREPIAAA